MYSLQYRPQMEHNKYGENGGRRLRRRPPFSGYGYGPSVACTAGCTWLMYSLCMAHIWPMYDLYMVYTYGLCMWPYMDILPVFLYGASYPAGVFEHAHMSHYV